MRKKLPSVNWSCRNRCWNWATKLKANNNLKWIVRNSRGSVFKPARRPEGQKRPNLAKNWHFGPNIGIFGPFDLRPDQKTMWTRCLGGFSVMWVTKLLISPVKKGFFAQKRPNLAQNWRFLSIAGSFGALLVGWLVVARAVSRKTPMYLIIDLCFFYSRPMREKCICFESRSLSTNVRH